MVAPAEPQLAQRVAWTLPLVLARCFACPLRSGGWSRAAAVLLSQAVAFSSAAFSSAAPGMGALLAVSLLSLLSLGTAGKSCVYHHDPARDERGKEEGGGGRGCAVRLVEAILGLRGGGSGSSAAPFLLVLFEAMVWLRVKPVRSAGADASAGTGAGAGAGAALVAVVVVVVVVAAVVVLVLTLALVRAGAGAGTGAGGIHGLMVLLKCL